MRNNNPGKEIAIVVSLGLLIALVITIVFWHSQQKNTGSLYQVSSSPTPLLTLPEKTPSPIEFTNLENETVFENKAIVVTGKTFPHAPVVIFVNRKNFFTTADENGNFSLNFNLESGSNIIEAVAVDENGNSYSDTRLVIYTNKSLEEVLLTEQEVLQEATTKAKKKP